MISSADLVAERARDVVGAPALHLQYIGGGIIDQPAPELDAFMIEQAYAIAAFELAGDFADARRQQAAAFFAQRLGGPGVDSQRSSRTQRKRDPMFAAF